MKSPTFRAQKAVGEPLSSPASILPSSSHAGGGAATITRGAGALTDAEQIVDAPSPAAPAPARAAAATPLPEGKEGSDHPRSQSADLFKRAARPGRWGMIRNNVHTRSLSSLTSLLDGGVVAEDPDECPFDAQEKPLGSQTRSDKVNKGLARALRVEMWRALKPKPEANNDAMASCNARKHVDDDGAEEGADMMLEGDIDIEREVQSLQRQFDAEQRANWKRGCIDRVPLDFAS